MAIEKQIKTKISLRYLDYATWGAESFKTEKPLKGEVWFCAIPQGNTSATTAPTMLFKVGDGVNTFGDLKWCSALAADVYDWAKKPEADFITWVNTIVEHPAAPVITTGSANGAIAVDGKDVAVKGLGSAAYTDASAYATSEQGTKADNAAAAIATYGDIVTHNASEFAPANIDTGVHSVALAGGTNNGTLKLTVDGQAVDNIAVTGLGNAAYTTVEALNATAKGYADAVLGTSADGAAANTVYGAKAAAAAAQSDATIAKTKIETFLGTVTPDGSQDIIDTLAEINSYIGDHGEEFATLSGKVTNIENGTTHTVAKSLDEDAVAQAKGIKVDNATNADNAASAANADKLDGHDSTYFATAESVSNLSNGLGDLAGKDKVTESDIDGTIGVSKITNFATEVAAVKVTNAGNADTLGTHAPEYFATAERVKALEDAKHINKVEADTGLKVVKGSTNEDNKVAIDTDVVFVLDCNW